MSRMTGNARSQMGTPMYEVLDVFTASVIHAVEPDGFPSRRRGPFIIVYCYNEYNHIRVEPRVLSVAGVGIDRGPQFSFGELHESRSAERDPTWFANNEINFIGFCDVAIRNRP